MTQSQMLLALGDRYRKFYRTLNNAKKKNQFNIQIDSVRPAKKSRSKVLIQFYLINQSFTRGRHAHSTVYKV